MAKPARVTVQPICVNLETAAAMLAVSESTVQALVRQGKLPRPRKISAGRVGWLVRELQEYAEQCEQSDLPPPPNTGAEKPRRRAA